MPYLLPVFLIILNCLQLVFVTSVFAAISACSASVSPSVVPANNSATLNFNVTNSDGANSVNWVRIARPSSRYEVTGGSSGGWSAAVSNPDSVTFTGSTISASSSQGFSININTSPLATGDQSWTVEVSDNGGGATTGCGGAITSISTDTTSPVISNIQATNITDSTATITWTTDENSSSSVDYGGTTSYGSSASGGGSTTSHTVNLSGLSNGSTYHFRVNSADSVGNNAQSGDNTFDTTGPPSTTPAPSPNPSSSSGSSNNSSSSSPSSPSTSPSTTNPGVPAETIRPVVVLSSDLSKPLKAAPTLTGSASDNVGVERVDYSLDGGRNWLPASSLSQKGGLKTNFSAVLKKLEDGNYNIRLRAIDKAGNIGLSKPVVLIIDQLPPLIGPHLFTVGPQILTSSWGDLSVLTGLTQKVTLSAIGGATKIDLVASPSGELKGQTFALEKNQDNGLWSADFSFDQPGLYQLMAEALDGAGNTFSRKLGSLNVLPNGQITGGEGPIKEAKILVYYFDQVTQRFIIWDGNGYSQQNPQLVDEEGRYKLLMPPGKYYLQIESPGSKSLKSSIFTLTQFTPINQDFKLVRKGWFDFASQTVQINLPSVDIKPLQNELVGQKLFDFTLTNGDQTLNSVFLEGKPTVISFLNSWQPQNAQQLANLELVNQKDQIQTLAIFSLESASFVESFRKSGGYQTPIFADPEGKILEKINSSSSPAHLFVDQQGVIRDIRFGLLTSDETEESLVN